MKRIFFALGIHNHQPVGNFDFVFEEAYQRSYGPFLAILLKHPKIKMAFHLSGILFEWLETHHPEYIDQLSALVKNGQVEIIGGGYYEPILSVIPEQDRQGQIRKLSEVLKTRIGSEPVGIWCAERVWEPHLAQSIQKAGMRYTILDDAHFKYAGLEEHELYGYFVTEEMGKVVNLFPICEKMRYSIPFQDPQATIDILMDIANREEDPLVVFADDGEKFGVWPGTYDHVYTDGWLEKFFSILEDNSDWIRLIHFKDALEKFPPKSRIYIPTASYREMMHWTLQTRGYKEYEDFENILKEKELYESYKIYVRGGFWRNFMVKYPESNAMQKKMLWVSQKVWKVEDRIPKATFDKAKDHLWAGQCNCPYWHGIFGGIYLPHLRHANYQHLITAGRMVDEAIRLRREWVDCRVLDYNADGRDEILLESRRLNLYFSTLGGRLFELDDRRLGINLLNLVNRREEGYYRKLLEISGQKEKPPGEGVASIHDSVLAKEEGLEKLITTDWYHKGGFIDHFLHEKTTLDDFSQCQYGEQGDFVNQPYEFKWEQKGNQVILTMERLGKVWIRENEHVPILLKKVVVLIPDRPEFKVTYTLENKGDKPVAFWFGVEFGFAFTSRNDLNQHYVLDSLSGEDTLLKSRGESQDVSVVILMDEKQKFDVSVSFSEPAGLWRFPLETISMSEGGFEKVFQGAILLSHWKINLERKNSWKIQIISKINKFK